MHESWSWWFNGIVQESLLGRRCTILCRGYHPLLLPGVRAVHRCSQGWKGITYAIRILARDKVDAGAAVEDVYLLYHPHDMVQL